MWSVPTRGVLRNLPIYLLPPDALHDSLNVLVRDGALQVRPGMAQISTTSLGSRPMGAYTTAAFALGGFQSDAFQNDAFQVGSDISAIVVVGTTRKIWYLSAGVFRDITDTPLTGGATSHVRMTSLQIGGTLWTLITNGVDTPRKWDGLSAQVQLVSGGPPLFTDVATIADRVVGIVPPYKIQWGQALSLDTWPSINVRLLADTPDSLVAIRNLGTMGGVVYKARSIWSIQPLGTTDASFFRIDLRALVPGPVSPAALVEADGAHYYMTSKGRIGMYDGAGHRWVADGAWGVVRKDLDPGTMVRAFGVYESLFREVWFFYPRQGDNGELRGGVVVCLPRPEEGIEQHIAFPFRMGAFVSAGTDLRLSDEGAMLLTAQSALAFSLSDAAPTDEGGAPISGYWQTGLVPAPEGIEHRIEGIETFAERGPGYGTLTVLPVYSYILDTPSGTQGPGATVDLSQSTPVYDTKGVDARGRFLGVRYSFPASLTLRWRGAVLDARPVGVRQAPPR
jgi:hypothetical protein